MTYENKKKEPPKNFLAGLLPFSVVAVPLYPTSIVDMSKLSRVCQTYYHVGFSLGVSQNCSHKLQPLKSYGWRYRIFNVLRRKRATQENKKKEGFFKNPWMATAFYHCSEIFTDAVITLHPTSSMAMGSPTQYIIGPFGPIPLGPNFLPNFFFLSILSLLSIIKYF